LELAVRLPEDYEWQDTFDIVCNATRVPNVKLDKKRLVSDQPWGEIERPCFLIDVDDCAVGQLGDELKVSKLVVSQAFLANLSDCKSLSA
jgi:hypothetical protein